MTVAVKPKWQVELFPSISVKGYELVTIYAYHASVGEDGQSIIADGVKIEFDRDVILNKE